MRRSWAAMAALALGLFGAGAVTSAALPNDLKWAYPPFVRPPITAPQSRDKTLRLEGAGARQSQAALSDLFHAVDWRPQNHPAMPPAVREGRAPDAMACGFCHLPNGQGRPENAALAGLPADYIAQQVADIQAGVRNEADPTWVPAGLMARTARAVALEDVAAAAQYFTGLKFVSRVRVKEVAQVPGHTAVAAVYRFSGRRPSEPLGDRILEGPTDFSRFEKRDDTVEFIAYVPPGSVARGRRLAEEGDHGRTQACESCHGEGLRGQSVGPPLAGRSPSYLFRQLLAFNTGARHGPGAGVMKGVTGNLRTSDMIDLAAFIAGLHP